MLATINETFEVVFISSEDEDVEFISEIDSDNREMFWIGDEVEVLKIVDDSTYGDGKAYVIFNPVNSASATVYSGVLTFK